MGVSHVLDREKNPGMPGSLGLKVTNFFFEFLDHKVKKSTRVPSLWGLLTPCAYAVWASAHVVFGHLC